MGTNSQFKPGFLTKHKNLKKTKFKKIYSEHSMGSFLKIISLGSFNHMGFLGSPGTRIPFNQEEAY